MALQHKAEFEALLENYRPSGEARRTIAQTALVLLLAPSSGGRNTIIRELLKTGEYHFIVSDTTRVMRVNDGIPEQDGVEYWFRSEEDVLADLKSGNYLEAEVIHGQQVSGMSVRELKQVLGENRIAINEVDLGGTEAVRKVKPDAAFIIVLPPSFEEWQRRLFARGPMDKEEHRRRLETALRIFSAATTQNFTLFVNDDLNEVTTAIHKFVTFGELDMADQQHARDLVKQLYIETDLFLRQKD